MRRALMLVFLLPLAAGCGAARTSDPGVDEVADKAAAAGSSRIAISYGGKTYFSGEFDFERDLGAFSWGLDEDGDWHQIITSDAIYTRFRIEELGLPRKGPLWTKSAASEEKDGLFEIFPTDPVRLLGALKAASSVEKVEAGEERGVAVTRYRASLDIDRALDALAKSGSYDEAFRATLRQFWTDGADEIPLDLAVDEEGLLRRVDVAIPDGERLSVEFFDYGLEVDAKPPPASQVLSMEEFIRLMEKLCSEGREDSGGLHRSCAEVRLEVGEPE